MYIVAVLEIGCLQENYMTGKDKNYIYCVLKKSSNGLSILAGWKFLKTNGWNIMKFSIWVDELQSEIHWICLISALCRFWIFLTKLNIMIVEVRWNVMAHAQKPDFVFQRKGRVHLNQRGCQFSRLLSAEVCASAVVMLDTPCSEAVWRVLATHSIRQFPLHSPPLQCLNVYHHISTGVYVVTYTTHAYNSIWQERSRYGF